MLQYIDSIQNIDAHNHTIDCIFHNEEIVRRISVAKIISEFNDTPQIIELLHPEKFSQVSLNSYGTLQWSNGIDFCPDVLYKLSEPV
jgi:hypothetical protein